MSTDVPYVFVVGPLGICWACMKRLVTFGTRSQRSPTDCRSRRSIFVLPREPPGAPATPTSDTLMGGVAMRDTVRFTRALAATTLLAAGVFAAILSACGGGYGGGSGSGGSGSNGTMRCGNGYVACPAPTITLTAPAAGATVSGTVALTATASASSTYGLTVTSVEFLIDGKVVGTVTSSPYTYMWNSTTVAAGSHSLTATVTDSAAGTATTPAIMITTTGMAAAAVVM